MYSGTVIVPGHLTSYALPKVPEKNNERNSSHPKLRLRIKHTLPKEMSIVKKERSGIYLMGTTRYFPGK